MKVCTSITQQMTGKGPQIGNEENNSCITIIARCKATASAKQKRQVQKDTQSCSYHLSSLFDSYLLATQPSLESLGPLSVPSCQRHSTALHSVRVGKPTCKLQNKCWPSPPAQVLRWMIPAPENLHTRQFELLLQEKKKNF